MRRARRITTAVVAAAACVAAIGTGSASAATLNASGGAVTYTGDSTEANHVTFRFNYFYGRFMIEDSGASGIMVTSPSNQGCHPYSAQLAYCDFGSVQSITAHLGGGGSFAQSKLALTPVTLYGGAGNDTLMGGGGADTLVGTGGNDTLVAGSGNTHLVASSGNVTMTGGSGHNTYEGGPGSDTIRSRNGVTEDITCGAGSDTVTADAADVAGADCESVDRGTQVDPGGTTADPGTSVPAVAPSLPVISPRSRTTSTNRVPVAISCPAAASNGCSGSVDLALPGGSVASAKVVAARRVKRMISRPKRFRIKAGSKAVVRVTLSRRGARKFRRAVRLHKPLKVVVMVAMNAEGGPRKAIRTITVRAERRSRGNQKARRRR